MFNCPDIQLGDQLKTINGVFMRGKTKDFVHATVRAIPAGSEIDFAIIKTFKEKGTGAEGLHLIQPPLLQTRLHDGQPCVIMRARPVGRSSHTTSFHMQAFFLVYALYVFL